MPIEYHDGICMMCHKAPIEVRHIDLYLNGSEGFYGCRACEDKIQDFIREESRKAIYIAIQRRKDKNKKKPDPKVTPPEFGIVPTK